MGGFTPSKTDAIIVFVSRKADVSFGTFLFGFTKGTSRRPHLTFLANHEPNITVQDSAAGTAAGAIHGSSGAAATSAA